jgi:hypothetical protein
LAEASNEEIAIYGKPDCWDRDEKAKFLIPGERNGKPPAYLEHYYTKYKNSPMLAA